MANTPADSLCVHGRETTEERRSADQAACSPASLNIKFFRSVWRRCRFAGRHAAAWTTRRENTTYAYFGARTASSRISCMQKGEQAKSGGRHWDQCPVCKKSRGLERYSGPFYFPVTRYQFPLPADVPEKYKILS